MRKSVGVDRKRPLSRALNHFPLLLSPPPPFPPPPPPFPPLPYKPIFKSTVSINLTLTTVPIEPEPAWKLSSPTADPLTVSSVVNSFRSGSFQF